MTVLHVLVAQHGDHAAGRGGQLGGDPVGVGRLARASRRAAAATWTRLSLSRTTGLGQEVLPDEVAEAVAEHVLLGRDDRGVRDRQAQRATEQRRDREPVGQRADHAGLGRRPHVADPARPVVDLPPASQQEDHGRDQEQPGGQPLHPAQVTFPGRLVDPAEAEPDFHGRLRTIACLPVPCAIGTRGGLDRRRPSTRRGVRSGGIRDGHEPIVPAHTNTRRSSRSTRPGSRPACPVRTSTPRVGAVGLDADPHRRGARPVRGVAPMADGGRSRGVGLQVVLAGVGGIPSTPATFVVRLRYGGPRQRDGPGPGAAPPAWPSSRRGATSRVNGERAGCRPRCWEGSLRPHAHRGHPCGPLGARV